MAIRGSAFNQTLANGDSLAKLILGNQNAQAQAAQQKDLDVQKAQELLPTEAQKYQTQKDIDFNTQGAEQARSIERAKELQAGLPKGASVNVGGASINTPDPMTMMMKNLAAQDRDDNQNRQETQALQQQFKQLGGVEPDQLRAFDDIDNIMKSPDNNSVGILRAKLARFAGEKGVLTDADVARYLPETLAGKAKGIASFITGKTYGDSITDEQKQNILRDLDAKRKALVAQQDSARNELSNRAGSLAPNLSRSGKVKQVLDSFGGTVRDAATKGKPKTVIQNGHTYTLNEATGQYE